LCAGGGGGAALRYFVARSLISRPGLVAAATRSSRDRFFAAGGVPSVALAVPRRHRPSGVARTRVMFSDDDDDDVDVAAAAAGTTVVAYSPVSVVAAAAAAAAV